jgi:mannose/cellobiose epimerase-like protein (N-acyl-D-glucosamine 2-epimerase family)
MPSAEKALMEIRFVYLFTIAYSMGEGPVAFQYSAEVFDNIHREQGMSWVVFINNFFGTLRQILADRL